MADSCPKTVEKSVSEWSNEGMPIQYQKADGSHCEYRTNFDGEVDQPSTEESEHDENSGLHQRDERDSRPRAVDVANFPLGWSLATRLIPSGAVKREYDMSASRPGLPLHVVRHEAIKFFQVLMSSETPYFKSIGEGWALNGFMYCLTEDDDVGVVVRQLDDSSTCGDTARVMLSVVTRDSEMESGSSGKISAAIEAWDYALRQLVNGASAQTVGPIRSPTCILQRF